MRIQSILEKRKLSILILKWADIFDIAAIANVADIDIKNYWPIPILRF